MPVTAKRTKYNLMLMSFGVSCERIKLALDNVAYIRVRMPLYDTLLHGIADTYLHFHTRFSAIDCHIPYVPY